MNDFWKFLKCYFSHNYVIYSSTEIHFGALFRMRHCLRCGDRTSEYICHIEDLKLELRKSGATCEMKVIDFREAWLKRERKRLNWPESLGLNSDLIDNDPWLTAEILDENFQHIVDHLTPAKE